MDQKKKKRAISMQNTEITPLQQPPSLSLHLPYSGFHKAYVQLHPSHQLLPIFPLLIVLPAKSQPPFSNLAVLS